MLGSAVAVLIVAENGTLLLRASGSKTGQIDGYFDHRAK
jgi:hypothetical protein